ncbi:uncharacterized protein AB675_7555 [Cyphellophora attinorum]|uniref:Uncharacterized protein n=1 Tax=Cyphellophora attinorum TaxID=1664694 RepID=A0A0N1HQS4_9EURO|nr:uncharacterized protein AB675_7555 [Phialophora attinorum]KPI40400.1 hypothetical protein AB675_7555 [Phialophora attinorum]
MSCYMSVFDEVPKLALVLLLILWFLIVRYHRSDQKMQTQIQSIWSYILGWYEEIADSDIAEQGNPSTEQNGMGTATTHSYELFYTDRSLWTRLLCRTLLEDERQRLETGRLPDFEHLIRSLFWQTLFAVGYSSSNKPRFNDLYADWIWHMVATEEQLLRRRKRILFLAPKAPRQSYCVSIFYTNNTVRRTLPRRAEEFEHAAVADDDGASQSSGSILDDGTDASSCSTAMTELTITVTDRSCAEGATSTLQDTEEENRSKDHQIGRSDGDYFDILCHDIGLALDRMVPPVTDADLDCSPATAMPRELFPIIDDALVDSIQARQQSCVSPETSPAKSVARTVRACECIQCSLTKSGVYMLDNETSIDDMLFDMEPQTPLHPMTAP